MTFDGGDFAGGELGYGGLAGVDDGEIESFDDLVEEDECAGGSVGGVERMRGDFVEEYDLQVQFEFV